MIVTTIPHVLYKLDEIVIWCENAGSRQGYFAALYRRMTLAVLDAMQQNGFNNNSRMEKLDVIFANRYIEAWTAYQSKQPVSKGWQVAFSSCDDASLIVIQHLLLGINTHINLDLSIATADACMGTDIFDLQNDFEKINQIMSSLINETQEKLTKVWWPLAVFSKIVNNRDDDVINFSIAAARKAAWANAIALAHADVNARTNYINGIDESVTTIANRIIQPGYFINGKLKMVKMFEYGDVKKIIQLIK
jgi:hypothetical protein